MFCVVYFSSSDGKREVIAVVPPDGEPADFDCGWWQIGSGNTREEIVADAEAADDWQAENTQNS
jgi:hypothetical protein